MNNFPREFMAVDGTMGNQIKFSEQTSICDGKSKKGKPAQNSSANTRDIIYGQLLIYSHIILCKLKQMYISS
jgi:hypothetical protein